MPGDRLAVGADEPRLRLAAGLEADRRVLAGLLAGDLDRRAPLVLGIEDEIREVPLRIKAVQLEAAVADRDPALAAARKGCHGSMWSVVRMKASVTVWPSGPSTRPLIVTPGRSAAATSCGGSPALTS